MEPKEIWFGCSVLLVPAYLSTTRLSVPITERYLRLRTAQNTELDNLLAIPDTYF